MPTDDPELKVKRWVEGRADCLRRALQNISNQRHPTHPSDVEGSLDSTTDNLQLTRSYILLDAPVRELEKAFFDLAKAAFDKNESDITQPFLDVQKAAAAVIRVAEGDEFIATSDDFAAFRQGLPRVREFVRGMVQRGEFGAVDDEFEDFPIFSGTEG